MKMKKIRFGELKLDEVISILQQNNLKLVIAENKNELMVNQINPDFIIQIDDEKTEGTNESEEFEEVQQ